MSITVDPSASAVCSMSAGVVTFVGAGTCTLNFNQAGGTDWAPASQVQQAFPVVRDSQSIGSLSTPPSHAVVGGSGYSPSASATSGLPVSITVDPSAVAACSISGSVVSSVASGTCILDFNQAGNNEWLPASEVKQSFAVLPAPVSGAVSGYWLVASDGGVFSYGDATYHGTRSGSALKAPVVGIAATPTGRGYWLVASDGGVFSYGDAAYYGSRGGSPLAKPVVGIAATPNGNGYWLVASDGGVFSYGDAKYYGSRAGSPLDKPIVGIAATPNGKGYWLVASDGGVFSYGDAAYYGSRGGSPLDKPVVGIAAYAERKGLLARRI